MCSALGLVYLNCTRVTFISGVVYNLNNFVARGTLDTRIRSRRYLHRLRKCSFFYTMSTRIEMAGKFQRRPGSYPLPQTAPSTLQTLYHSTCYIPLKWH